MNTLEAGVISGIPIGGIVGGVLCKSYGLLPTVGGVIAGGIAGAFSGWLYALLIAFIFSVIAVIWRAMRGLPELAIDDGGDEVEAYFFRTTKTTTILKHWF